MHECPLKCLSPAYLSSLLRAKRSGVKKENTFPFFLPFCFSKKKNRHDNDREYPNLEGECNLKAFKQVSHCDSSMAFAFKSLATSANETIKMTLTKIWGLDRHDSPDSLCCCKFQTAAAATKVRVVVQMFTLHSSFKLDLHAQLSIFSFQFIFFCFQENRFASLPAGQPTNQPVSWLSFFATLRLERVTQKKFLGK